MHKAYIKADSLEDPQILNNLIDRLKKQGIQSFITSKDWKDIWDPQPFLYFRTPYLRFDKELEIITFHYCNSHVPFLKTLDDEIVSVNRSAKENYEFVLNVVTRYEEPVIEPLPILLGTYNRHAYLALTLNSLMYSLKSKRQKVYIVASEPNDQTRQTLHDLLEKDSRVEVVISPNNLKYSFANFGSKFYDLKKFIHFEEDGLLPEHLSYHIPFWTSQLNHRSTTAEAVAFRTYEGNWSRAFYKCQLMVIKKVMEFPKNELWYYTTEHNDYIVPIGGNGIVIDSPKHYKNFTAPGFHSADSSILKDAKCLCVVNLPVYHIGANQEMDYPDYAKNKNSTVLPTQHGIDWRTGVVKTIDLEKDWTLASP